jgi:iron complex transport system ATP-binding protein
VVASGPPREVLTEDLLAAHYRVRVKVIDGGQGPLVVPVRG